MVCACLHSTVPPTVSCKRLGQCPALTLHPRRELPKAEATRGAGPAYLQAVANPPIEDSEVGVQGQQHGCEVHLLVDAKDRGHFEVESLQGG